MQHLLEKYIPASRLDAVMTACSSTISGAVTDIHLLAGGLSQAAVLRIETANRAYLVKVSIDEAAESTAGSLFHQYAAKAGVAPELLYADRANGVLITDYIHAQPVDQALSQDKKILLLAENIRALHQREYPYEQGAGVLLNIVDQVITWFNEQPFLSDDIKNLLRAGFDPVREFYPWNDSYRVLSHNDLNPRNVLCDGVRLWFIDWDAASLNDPYVDLAIAANFFTYTPEAERLLLHTYFEAPASPYQYARFTVMRQVCQLIYAKMIMSLALRSAPADHMYGEELDSIGLMEIRTKLRSGELSMDNYSGQLLYGRALFNDSLKQINSNSFTGQLNAIRTGTAV